MALRLPEPDERRLSKSPLELVVFQVQYDTRLAVADGQVALALQEALERYPRVEPVSGVSVTVPFGPAGVGPSAEQTQTGWRLISEDGNWIVSVMPDQAGLETTAFGIWEEGFRPRAEALLAALAEHVAPSLEQRLGLRFVDRIAELELTRASDWAEYISERLLGPVLDPAYGEAVRAAQQQLLLELDAETRCGMRHGPLFDQSGRVDYLLDYDVF